MVEKKENVVGKTQYVGSINERQKLFVEAYCDSGSKTYGNAAASARAAGYSEKNSRVTGCELLKNGAVQAAIQAKRKEVAVRAERSKEDLAAEVWGNYLSAPSNMKYRWMELYLRLGGHLVEKKEIKTEDVTEKVNNSVADYIRNLG